MGFLTPDVPTPPPAPNPASTPMTPKSLLTPQAGNSGYGSPFVAGPAGLRRKSALDKTSLIGGG
jgi:hypothetical protein